MKLCRLMSVAIIILESPFTTGYKWPKWTTITLTTKLMKASVDIPRLPQRPVPVFTRSPPQWFLNLLGKQVTQSATTKRKQVCTLACAFCEQLGTLRFSLTSLVGTDTPNTEAALPMRASTEGMGHEGGGEGEESKTRQMIRRFSNRTLSRPSSLTSTPPTSPGSGLTQSPSSESVCVFCSLCLTNSVRCQSYSPHFKQEQE